MKNIDYSSIKEFVEKSEASIQTGPFGTQLKASDYQSSGTPVINVRNIGYGKELQASIEYISEKLVDKLKQHKLAQGDIVFARKGAVDRHLLVAAKQEGYLQGSDCIKLRLKSKEVSKKFLSYYFLTEGHKRWMEAQGSFGATMGSLNQGIINRISFLSPLSQSRKRSLVSSLLTTN